MIGVQYDFKESESEIDDRCIHLKGESFSCCGYAMNFLTVNKQRSQSFFGITVCEALVIGHFSQVSFYIGRGITF